MKRGADFYVSFLIGAVVTEVIILISIMKN